MADTMNDHAGHNIRKHDNGWSGCVDCGRWIDTRAERGELDNIIRITAGELRAGHSILGRTGQGCSSSLNVSKVYRSGDTITACTRLGDHEYSAADVVVIWQD